MKEWKEYLFKVNGFEMTAVYNEDTIQKVFLPLFKTITAVTKGKKGTDHCIYGSTAGCWKDNIM